MLGALLVVAPLVLLAAALAAVLLIPLRRRSYRAWPVALRWPWLALVGLFLALGFYGVTVLAATEIGEKRPGLGIGFFVAIVLGTIKGLWPLAASRLRRHGDT